MLTSMVPLKFKYLIPFAWRKALPCVLMMAGVCAQAQYSHMDTGEFLDVGKFQFQTELQTITSGNQGLNLIVRARGGWTEELNWQAMLGAGTTDFVTSGFVKWVPVPDIEGQPAIGVSGGLLLANYSFTHLDRTLDGTELSIRVHPFISKRFETDIGQLTPYAALPLGWRNMAGYNDLPIQMALGSSYKAEGWDQLKVVAELGMNLNQAFSYISIGLTLGFDPEQGWLFP